MAYCSKCGAEVRGRFCSNCGNSINALSVQQDSSNGIYFMPHSFGYLKCWYVEFGQICSETTSSICAATKFHSSSVIAFPLRKIVTISVMTHFLHMFLNILFLKTSKTDV